MGRLPGSWHCQLRIIAVGYALHQGFRMHGQLRVCGPQWHFVGATMLFGKEVAIGLPRMTQFELNAEFVN